MSADILSDVDVGSKHTFLSTSIPSPGTKTDGPLSFNPLTQPPLECLFCDCPTFEILPLNLHSKTQRTVTEFESRNASK